MDTKNKIQYTEITKEQFKEWLDLGMALWPAYGKKILESYFKLILKDKHQTAFVCRNKKKLIAFINVSIRKEYVEGSNSSPVGYIEGIYVKPKQRKKGIAKQLIKLAEQWSKKKGCTELGSDTELHNKQSQKFHKSIGFKKAEVIVHFIKKIK